MIEKVKEIVQEHPLVDGIRIADSSLEVGQSCPTCNERLTLEISWDIRSTSIRLADFGAWAMYRII